MLGWLLNLGFAASEQTVVTATAFDEIKVNNYQSVFKPKPFKNEFKVKAMKLTFKVSKK